MFEVGDSLPTEELQAGSYLLAGPAMSGKYELMLDVIVEGVEQDEAILFVTTNESAGPILDDIEARAGSLPDQLHVVDCIAERQGTDGRYPPERVEYVSSPADLTGIGIGVSELLRRFAGSDAERTRICFYSLSTVLVYAELENLFRFLHVLSGRVDRTGALGLFAIDPTTHEENTVNTLKQLFDGRIEVKQDGERQVRLAGIPGASGEWVTRS